MNIQESINEIVSYIANKWKLSNIRPLVPSSFTNNYVALAHSEKYKTDVVLKVLFANTHEPETLILFNGNGCVKLLDYDQQAKCLLLEYVSPGFSLKTLFPEKDNFAIKITAKLIKKMHVKNLLTKAVGFKSVNQWLDLLHRFKSKKISFDLLQKAQELSDKLLNLKQELYLLHGDLHHENILQSDTEWIAIDPKGVIGPLEYEVGRFILNPIPDLLQQSNVTNIIQNRINTFSRLFGFNSQRLADWAFVQAVLSACWSEQDGSEDFFNYFIKFAEMVQSALL